MAAVRARGFRLPRLCLIRAVGSTAVVFTVVGEIVRLRSLRHDPVGIDRRDEAVSGTLDYHQRHDPPGRAHGVIHQALP